MFLGSSNEYLEADKMKKITFPGVPFIFLKMIFPSEMFGHG